MQWDLEDEHSWAYDEELCNRINVITDTFDGILDYTVPKMYPMMACVDVFPCKDNIGYNIPIYIQRYLEEGQRSRYDFELTLENKVMGDINTILRSVFLIDKDDGVLIRINNTSEKLVELLGEDVVTKYSIDLKDLYILQNEYIGILTEGYVLQCGEYSIVILIGTNE